MTLTSTQNRKHPRNPGSVSPVTGVRNLNPYIKLLSHFNGTNDSTVFPDEKQGWNWSVGGNSKIDTSQYVFNGSSIRFDGNGDYIFAPTNSLWRFDDGSNANKWLFDVRMRWAVDPGTGTQGICGQYVDSTHHWNLTLTSNTLRVLARDGSSTPTINLSNAFNPAVDTWYHIAFVKNGTTGYMMFVDGVQVGTTQTNTTPLPNLSANFEIGRYTDSAGAVNYFNGWMAELRLDKGDARWTSGFTVPVEPYSIYL